MAIVLHSHAGFYVKIFFAMVMTDTNSNYGWTDEINIYSCFMLMLPLVCKTFIKSLPMGI